MEEEVNPYAPPKLEPVAIAPQPAALTALRAPSLGLLLLSGSMCLGIPMLAFALCVNAAIAVRRLAGGLDPNLPTWEDALGLTAGLVCIVSSIFVVRGSLCMRRGKNYRAALIAAILSCIPILLFYIGIPFGIWALVVLRRPAVRAAFDHKATCHHVAAAEAGSEPARQSEPPAIQSAGA